MNWRTLLAVVLLAGAAITGWSAWRQAQDGEAGEIDLSRSDYVLRDFELVTLDSEGRESFSRCGRRNCGRRRTRAPWN